MKNIFFLFLLITLLLTACPGQSTTLDPPKDLKVFPGDKKLALTWTPSSEGNLKGYLLSWQTSDGKTKNSEHVGLGKSAIIDNLQNGVSYLVTIATQDLGGHTSAPSAAVAAVPVGPLPPTAPATPTGLKATPQDGQITLTWTPNLEPDLNHYTLHWGSGTNLDQFVVIKAPANSYILKGLSNGTSYSFALDAQSSLGLTSARSGTISATPKAAPMAPLVSDIKITVTADGNVVDLGLSKQVRQGVGLITLAIQGSRLDTLLSAKLGDIPFTIAEKQEGSASLNGIISHGAFLGEQVLLLENDGGSTSIEGAVEVTRITIAENILFNPSDTCLDPTQPKLCGLGTPNRPFRTLSKALATSGEGDTILLTAGTYSLGETWPQSSGIPAPNVPANVTIEGQSSDRNSVLLKGPGKTSGYSGLVFAGNGTVKNLSLRDFKYALMLRQGSVPQPVGNLTLYNIDSSNNFDGVHVFNAESLTIQDSLFVGNGDDGVTGGGSGIYVAYTTLVDISGSTPNATKVEGNVYGIFMDHDSFGSLNSLNIPQNIRDGVFIESSGINIYNSQITDNGYSGIYLHIPDFSRGIDIANTVLSGNKFHGFHVTGNPLSIELDNCALQNNTNWQLFDQRDANNILSLFSVNTTYQGILPYPGTATSVTSGAGGLENNTGGKKLYRIDKVGNTIAFNSL